MIQKDNQPIMQAGFTTLCPNSHITQNLAILRGKQTSGKKNKQSQENGSRQYHHL
jgi:hypothetical protein